MKLTGDVLMTVSYPVEAGEVIRAGTHVYADALVGAARSSPDWGDHVGIALFDVDNSAGKDGDAKVVVCYDGLATGFISSFEPGVHGLGSYLHPDADGNPVMSAANPQNIGKIMTINANGTITYRIITQN